MRQHQAGTAGTLEMSFQRYNKVAEIQEFRWEMDGYLPHLNIKMGNGWKWTLDGTVGNLEIRTQTLFYRYMTT